MVKQGYKAITVPEVVFDKARVLSNQPNLGLGSSVASVVDRAINLLVEEYRERFAKYQGETFEEALVQYQKAKGQAPIEDFKGK